MKLTDIYDYLPGPVKPAAKQLYYKQRWARFYVTLPYLRFLDRFKLNNLDSIYSEEYFTQRRNPPHDTVANEFTATLIDRYKPHSVADVGCSIGHYLAKIQEQDDEVEVFGVEGAQRAIDNAVIDNIRYADLRSSVRVDEDYDLVLCIEVAEHLHPKYADRIVETVCSAGTQGSTIVFTAAPPGQYGTYHINLQPQGYWIDKFEKKGATYQPDESTMLIQELKSRIPVTTSPLENIMVFELE